MQSCNMNWCTYTMPELLLEIEDRMDDEKSLFLQVHRSDEVLKLVKGNFQSTITNNRIDIVSASFFKNLEHAGNSLKYLINVQPIDHWKLIRNVVRLSNDQHSSLLFITENDADALRMNLATSTAGHRRMMFTQSLSDNLDEVYDEVSSEKPDVIVSDMAFEAAEKTYLNYKANTHKPLIWIQVPDLKVANKVSTEKTSAALLQRVMAPYHRSKLFVNDTVKLYQISAFLRKENG